MSKVYHINNIYCNNIKEISRVSENIQICECDPLHIATQFSPQNHQVLDDEQGLTKRQKLLEPL